MEELLSEKNTIVNPFKDEEVVVNPFQY